VKRIGVSLCFVIFSAFLAGCGGWPVAVGHPRVNIVSVTPKEMKIFEQIFTMDLRIQNTSDTSLAFNGMAFELEINDRLFATGVFNKTLTLNRLSSEIIQVEAFTNLTTIMRQVMEDRRIIERGLKYRLKGVIYIGSPSFRIPFDESGEF
jgi:LEA14-like dessication related protein